MGFDLSRRRAVAAGLSGLALLFTYLPVVKRKS